jgi:hypothetical protein
MNPTKKQPLFIITGASGVCKSSICGFLFNNETDYIVLGSDLLWHDIYNTPEDGYRNYRELWLRVCAQISQIGKPVVLCGCATPDQFEVCDNRSAFSVIHYLAIVSSDATLENRMRNGRGIADDNWIKSSVRFNGWLRENAGMTEPKMKLLDTTDVAPELSAKKVDHWIHEYLNCEK